MNNNLHIESNFGVFIGSFDNNQIHQHYAIQWSIALSEPIEIKDEVSSTSFVESVLIKSNITHQFHCSGHHLLFLFSPISQTGHFLQQQSHSGIAEYRNGWSKKLQSLGKNYLVGKLPFPDFITQTKEILEELSYNDSNNNPVEDDRITKALKFIEQNTDRVIPAHELAKYCHLSESRFLHLFKEKTNITYRQAQLWIKLSQSIPKLFKQKITETAYEFGFSDSAHYSKVFKQNFGFSPRLFSKL